MPDFTWDHMILLVSVLSLAAFCYWNREPNRKQEASWSF